MAVSVAAKQLKAGSVALGSLWKVVATVTQRCVLHKRSAKWLYGDRIIEPTRKNLQSDSMLSYHAVYTASRKDLTDSLLRVLYCAFR